MGRLAGSGGTYCRGVTDDRDPVSDRPRTLRARVAPLVVAALLLAGCSGGSDSEPEPPTSPSATATGPGAPPPTEMPDDPDLTVVAFNALGDTHTRDGGDREELGSGVERGAKALDLLGGYDPDLIAFQELQRPEAAFVKRRLGKRYGMLSDHDNSVLWRRDVFTVLSRTTLSIPYFHGRPREMPVARLRVTGTRRVVTVVGIHNPASVHGDATAYRAEAVAIERALVQRERDRGRTVLLMGDFNDHELTFCALAKGGLMTSANGGAMVDGECVPPANLQIDWIFGAGVTFTSFLSDTSTRDDEISDHPMLAATLVYGRHSYE